MIFWVANDSHLAAKFANQLSLWHTFSSVVSPFGVNVRSKRAQDALYRLIVKDNNVMHADQRGDELGGAIGSTFGEMFASMFRPSAEKEAEIDRACARMVNVPRSACA